MPVFENMTDFFYPKTRPDEYKAEDAAYAVGGNKGGGVLASYPSDYPKTPQQEAVGKIAKACGIKKGIDKADLQRKQEDCVGPAMSDWEEGKLDDILNNIEGGEYTG